MKRVIIGLIGILFCLCIYTIYFFATFKIFDDEFKLIQEIKLLYKSYDIHIYHIPSNASSEDYIQVRKIENAIEEVIENYSNYNRYISYRVEEDTLYLNIKDSVKVNQDIKKMKLP